MDFITECRRLSESVSTNDDAFRLLEDLPTILVWTTNQTSGRGSRGRGWISPKDHAVAVSIGFYNDHPSLSETPIFPLLAGIAIYDAVAHYTDAARLSLKWPNDLLLDGAKLAGILCESRWMSQTARIVVGIGINLKTHTKMVGLPKGYACLNHAWPDYHTEQLVNRLSRTFGQWIHADGQTVKDAWLSRSKLSLGTHLRIHAEERSMEGAFMGLDDEGNLLIQPDGDKIIAIRQSCQDFEILGRDRP